MKRRKSWRAAVPYLGILLAGVILSVAVLHSMQPDFFSVKYRFEGKEWQEGTMPLLIPEEGDILFVEVPVRFGFLRPVSIRIKPDDCLEELSINGVNVDEEGLAYCDYASGKNFRLGSYLKAGDHLFSFKIRDTGGMVGVKFAVSKNDPITLLVLTALLILIVLCSERIVRLSPRFKSAYWVGIVIIFGIVLRIVYVLATPYEERGHDTDAHIDYIDYVAEHWSLPLAHNGWEFHQPPVYYILSAAWTTVGELFGLARELILTVLQYGSLLLSIATLFAGVAAGLVLFDPKKQKVPSLLYTGLIALFPALLLFSSRISNDSLYQLTAFLFVLLLVKWWKTGERRDWIALCSMIILSSLVKVTSFLFVPVAFGCLLLRDKVPLTKKIRIGLISGIFVCAAILIMPLHRASDSEPGRMLQLGNKGMHSGLIVPSETENYLTFNPLKILTTPYNNPWEDEARRQYFPEYFYRSAFTGEFRFPDAYKTISIALLAAGFLLLLLGIWGFVREQWVDPHRSLPMTLVLLLQLAASFFYRFRFAYSSNQDFRFAIVAVIPIAYFIVRGIEALPRRLQKAAIGLVILSGVLVTIFVCMLLLRGGE